MDFRSRLAAGAAALCLATAAWPQIAVAQDSRPFEQLKAGGGRFEIIGGAASGTSKPAALQPVARAVSAPAATNPVAAKPDMMKPAAASPAVTPPQAMKPAAVRAEAPTPPEASIATAATPSIPETLGAEPPISPAEAPAIVTASLPPDPMITGAVPAHPPMPHAVAPAIDDNMKIPTSGNALMIEALRRARASLEDFLKMANAPPEGTSGFAVKVLVGPREAREALWVSALERRVQRNFLFGASERWSGRLANAPTEGGTLRVGDRIAFETSEIRDWTYFVEGGRPMGNFTACALTAPEGRAKLAELTEKTGLDCGWIAQAAKTAAR